MECNLQIALEQNLVYISSSAINTRCQSWTGGNCNYSPDIKYGSLPLASMQQYGVLPSHQYGNGQLFSIHSEHAQYETLWDTEEQLLPGYFSSCIPLLQEKLQANYAASSSFCFLDPRNCGRDFDLFFSRYVDEAYWGLKEEVRRHQCMLDHMSHVINSCTIAFYTVTCYKCMYSTCCTLECASV